VSGARTDALIAALAADARPIAPLAPPLHRALTILGAIVVVSLVAIAWRGDVGGLLARYAGREHMMALESIAMLATGVLAVVGAFFLSIPGTSRRWMLAPVVPFVAWVTLSGAGCYDHFLRNSASGWGLGHSIDCLLFILAVSLVLAIPLIWRLSRASPIDPLPVAILGGLGTASLAALLLQFFHPFAVTFLDLGVHLFAIILVVAAMAAFRRGALVR